jgi:hypothetical protein
MNPSKLTWSGVTNAEDLKNWLSQAKITTTFWGGRAFKVDADKTGVNLNVVLAKIQDLRKKNLIDDSSLKNVINLFLERDVTPMTGGEKAKELYIARFWGNKQTAKRNEALSKLIGSLKEGADELRENQILSQGLKEVLKSTDIDKEKIKELYEKLIDHQTTPQQAVECLRGIKGLDLSKLQTYLSSHSELELNDIGCQKHLYLKAILGQIESPQRKFKNKDYFSVVMRFGAATFSRTTCLALSKINWMPPCEEKDIKAMQDACKSMCDDPVDDVELLKGALESRAPRRGEDNPFRKFMDIYNSTDENS